MAEKRKPVIKEIAAPLGVLLLLLIPPFLIIPLIAFSLPDRSNGFDLMMIGGVVWLLLGFLPVMLLLRRVQKPNQKSEWDDTLDRLRDRGIDPDSLDDMELVQAVMNMEEEDTDIPPGGPLRPA